MGGIGKGVHGVLNCEVMSKMYESSLILISYSPSFQIFKNNLAIDTLISRIQGYLSSFNLSASGKNVLGYVLASQWLRQG